MREDTAEAWIVGGQTEKLLPLLRRLRQFKFNLLTVEDCFLALKLLDETMPPDLIFLDLSEDEEEDSRNFLRRFAFLPRAGDLPLIGILKREKLSDAALNTYFDAVIAADSGCDEIRTALQESAGPD